MLALTGSLGCLGATVIVLILGYRGAWWQGARQPMCSLSQRGSHFATERKSLRPLGEGGLREEGPKHLGSCPPTESAGGRLGAEPHQGHGARLPGPTCFVTNAVSE